MGGVPSLKNRIRPPLTLGSSVATMAFGKIKTWGVNEVDKPEKCWCRKGHYKYASALYAYYTCGHVFERPLNEKEQGEFVPYDNPYEKKRE